MEWVEQFSKIWCSSKVTAIFTFEFLHTESNSGNYVMIFFICWFEMVEDGGFAGIV